MHGKNFVAISDLDLRQWIHEKTGCVLKFPFQILNPNTQDMIIVGEIDNEQTTFETIKKLTLGGKSK